MRGFRPLFLMLVVFLASEQGWTEASSPPRLRPISLPELLPEPTTKVSVSSPGNKVIESFHVKSDIRFRFATTQMVSVVRNTAKESQEVVFDITLPKEAFIVSFSMAIDGKIYDGEVKEKAEAKAQYQAAVDRGQSAGHVRQAPRHSNVFEMSVNVAAGSAVNFTLVYQEMLRRKLGVYEHEIHVDPGQAVEDFKVEIYIQENKPLTFVKTPALRTDSLISNDVEADNQLTIIDRPSDSTAHIVFEPTLEEQGDGGVSAQFVVQYDVEHGAKGDVLVVDGYFIHFFAPDLPPMRKDIVFVLDVSGSMSGKKLKQLKEAMMTILGDLDPKDRFNIITFSSDVHVWKDDLVEPTSLVMTEAQTFVRRMRADGMTNIADALKAGISALQKRKNLERVPMVFFLTDGVPTAGITNSQEIAKYVDSVNNNFASIFCLAFGNGADFDSLKTISAQNSGFARKIYEASDSALQVSSLYDEISSVVMKDIKVNYLPSSVDEYSITEQEFPVVFNGTEVIICGMLSDQALTFKAEVAGIELKGNTEIDLMVDDLNTITIDMDAEDALNPFFTVPRDFAGIVEKMWAFLTIKQLLREKEKHVSDESKVEDLKQKILRMSLKYKFVTPLTSMVVTKPEAEDKPVATSLRDAMDDSRRFDDPIPIQHSYSQAAGLGPAGMSGFPGMGLASSMYRDPSPSRQKKANSVYRARYNHQPSWNQRPVVPTRPRATTTSTRTTRARTTTSSSTTPRTTTVSTVKHQGRRYRSKGSRIIYMTAILDNRTVCLVPRKKIKCGTYKLLEATNGHTVFIETACSATENITNKFSNIRWQYGVKSLTVDLKRSFRKRAKTSSGWVYTGTVGGGSIHSDKMKLQFSGDGISMTVNRKGRKFSLELMLNPHESYTGMMGDLLRLPKRRFSRLSRRKRQLVCPKDGAGISMMVKNKKAIKYRTQL